jgi:thioredoxin 1
MFEVTTEQELQKQVKANFKLLALFYASWCPFCRSFITIFDKYSKNSGDNKYLKVRIDEDENPIWETYGFEAVPSLILFENGKVSRRLDCNLGAGLNEKQFVNWLKPEH